MATAGCAVRCRAPGLSTMVAPCLYRVAECVCPWQTRAQRPLRIDSASRRSSCPWSRAIGTPSSSIEPNQS